jgi:hypothetical protein
LTRTCSTTGLTSSTLTSTGANYALSCQ